MSREAGRELDATIRILLGGKYTRSYSTDIDAAWDVVEFMLKYGHLVCISHDYPESDDKWVVSFSADGSMDGIANTMPLAVCRAAILAMEAK